jgi:methionine-rich copper-binding protein CopC
MRNEGALSRKIFVVGMLAVMLGVAAKAAWAHAILMKSSPAAGAVVSGPHLAIVLDYNSRVNASLSQLVLVRPDGKRDKLAISEGKDGAELLSAADGLTAGDYRLSWQVLARDGHITNGTVPFKVK